VFTVSGASDYENNQQDALYRLIYYSKSALHVSDVAFAHHQEHLGVYIQYLAVFTQVAAGWCRQQLGLRLPDIVNTVKYSR